MNKEEFLKIYNDLPKRLQEALYSDKIISIIKSAGLLAKLNDKELFVLNETVTDMLLGQVTFENFSEELKTRLKISETSMEIISRIIQDKIFKPLYKELKECKRLSIPQSQPQSQPQPQTQPPKKEVSSKPPISIKENYKQPAPKQPPSEQIIPEYSFPEPSKITVEKPVNKTEELKKIVTPKTPSDQQEKIREKLLAAMQKRNGQPKIVEQMKKVSLKPPALKKIKEEEMPERIKIGELTPSKILSGEGKEFEDEKAFVKTDKGKPYIFDAKLKEKKEKKEELPAIKEPIPYKKYQKKSPFGKA